MRRTTLGSDEGIQATATDAAEGKLSAASLGYFHDPFAQFFVHSRTQGAPGGHGERARPRRSPPVINRGESAPSLQSFKNSYLSWIHWLFCGN